MRSLSTDVLAAIQSASGEARVFLIEIEFSDGILYLSTGSRDLVHDSQTWVAVGGALAIGAVEESNDQKGAGIDLILSGIDQSIVSSLLNANYRGRNMIIRQAILDPVVGDVVDTIMLFPGLQLDNYEIQEVVERGRPLTVTIRTRGRHRLSVDEFRGIRANLHSHQSHFAGDTFFTHVGSLAGKKVFWGTTSAGIISTPGGGGGGSDDVGNPDEQF